MLKSRKDAAFTLIEIVMVVIILGIMAALAIPKIAGPSFEKAAFSEAVGHLAVYATSQKSYFFDKNVYDNTSGCTNLDVDVTFKNFESLTCNEGGTAGNVSVSRKGGNYKVSVDATGTTPVYACKKTTTGTPNCDGYLMKLLPK